MEIPGVDKKRSGISKGSPEKIMWNFNKWVLVLDF